MKPLKRLRGLDAEFFAQQAACVSEGSQRVGLTAGSVQRQHEQAVQPLPQRVLGDQIPQLRDQVGVTADRQVKLDALLEDADARLGQPVACASRNGLDRPSQTGPRQSPNAECSASAASRR